MPINLSCARSSQGNAKGDIENRIKFIKTNLLRYLKGYRRKAGQQRGTGDPKKKAVYTTYEIRALIIQWILVQNKNKALTEAAMPMTARVNKVTATAQAVWNWGVTNLCSPLKAISDKELWVRFLPERDVDVTHRGIEYRNSRYTCKEYEKDRVFERAKNEPFEAKARIDDTRPDLLYLHDKRTGELIRCERIRFAEGIERWSHADAEAMHLHHLDARKKQDKPYASASAQQMVQIDEANEKATVRAQALGAKSTSAKTVAEHRAEEQARLRSDDQAAAYEAYESPPPQKPKRMKASDPVKRQIDEELNDIIEGMN